MEDETLMTRLEGAIVLFGLLATFTLAIKFNTMIPLYIYAVLIVLLTIKEIFKSKVKGK